MACMSSLDEREGRTALWWLPFDFSCIRRYLGFLPCYPDINSYARYP